jgi:hypothetical protein
MEVHSSFDSTIEVKINYLKILDKQMINKSYSRNTFTKKSEKLIYS